jgi:hypothetical protein
LPLDGGMLLGGSGATGTPLRCVFESGCRPPWTVTIGASTTFGAAGLSHCGSVAARGTPP